MKSIFLVLLFFSGYCFGRGDVWWIGSDLSGKPCRDVDEAQYGPYDYTKPEERATHLPIVEEYHFSKETEALMNDQDGHPPPGAINYTLSAFPNHHRALLAASRYQLLRDSGVVKQPLNTPVECYFNRAINFSKQDGHSYLLYAKYLTKKKKYDTAKELYEKAVTFLPNDPAAHYNYGLMLLETNNYEEARNHAELAKKYGHPSAQHLLGKLNAIKH